MTIVMGILIIAFALWGVGDYFSQSGSESLASVNGETITYSDYSNQFATYRQNMLSQYGDQLTPDFFDSPMMRRNFLESMINSELRRQVAYNNGYTVTPAKIRAVLSEVEIFQDANGQFDRDLYAGYLAQTNQSAQALQAKIINEDAGQAVNSLFNETAFITPQEAQQIAVLKNQTRDFSYVLVASDNFKDSVEVSEAEIKSYYDNNNDQFMTQEMVKVDYIELDAEQVASDIDVSDADALSDYESNKERFKKPAQRKTAHILITDNDQAENALSTIQERLNQGDSFASLAKEYSQDPGSAEQGGDLGMVSPGDMVEAFDAALFSMEANTISEPIKSEFGYHIIKLEDINEPEISTFEEVKEDIVHELQANQAQTLFLDRANELSGLVLDAQSGLQQAAEATNLTVQTTDFFPQSGGENIAANQDFVKSAYSPMVKQDLVNSDVITISDTHIAFIHMNEIKAAALKPLDEVKEDIKNKLIADKSAEQAQTLAAEILDKAKSGGTDLTALAAQYNLTKVEANAVKRSGSSHPYSMVNEVFSLVAPDKSESNYYLVNGNNNDRAVVHLLAVNSPDPSQIENLQQESAQLERSVKDNELQLLLQALRQSADISINEELLNQQAQF